MLKIQTIKKKWLKLIPTTLALKKKNIGVFFHGNHIQYTLLNWNKIWIYIQYQLYILKNILIWNSNILIITDIKKLNISMQKFAKKLKIAFIFGAWKGGCLTKIETPNLIPSFVLNFGLVYTQNFYNEITIMQIPCINIITTDNKLINQSINYNFFIGNNKNYNLYYLFTFFIWFIKKYQTTNFYENFSLIQGINSQFIKFLQIIYNQIKIFEFKTSKIWLFKNQKLFYKNSKQLNLKYNFEIHLNYLNNLNYMEKFEKLYFPKYLIDFYSFKQKFLVQQEIVLKTLFIKKKIQK